MITATLAQENIFSVYINDVLYTRADLTYTLDSEAETLAVMDGEEEVLAATPYSEIAADGSDTPFASMSLLQLWVETYMRNNVVTVVSIGLNRANINDVEYAKTRLGIKMYEQTGELVVTANGNANPVINTDYTNIVPDGGGSAFSSFSVMESWVNTNLRFNGQQIDTTEGENCYRVNGKPMAFNRMYFAWDDENETLEIRHSHYDYSDKPMPATFYGQIVEANNAAGFESYQDLIRYITANCFKP
jgi:hypothetical protein